MGKNSLNALIAPLIEPYMRYQYANILHAIRLGCAVVIALIVNYFSTLPHGEWTTITVFIILGLLQYQGAIYTKAKERIIGTLLGIFVGLSLLCFSHFLLPVLWFYYLLIGCISGVIGYYAIKQLGYTGMLTGITMCMIISSTNSIGIDGIYRASNVLIGTAISILVTVIMPLKSTLMWRFLLANNLDACSDVYDGVESYIANEGIKQSPRTQLSEIFNDANRQNTGVKLSDSNTVFDKDKTNKDMTIGDDVMDDHQRYYDHAYKEVSHSTPVDLGATTVISQDDFTETKLDNLVDASMVTSFKKINKRLLRVRGHIAATASETGIETQTLDQIQRTHRNIIGTIDLLLSAAPKLSRSSIDADNLILLKHYHHELTQAMHHIAAVLRSPSDEEFRAITKIKVSNYPSIHNLSFDWQGFFWLTQTLQSQLQSLSDLLNQTKPQWFKASGLRYQRQEQRRITTRGGEGDLDV